MPISSLHKDTIWEISVGICCKAHKLSLTPTVSALALPACCCSRAPKTGSKRSSLGPYDSSVGNLRATCRLARLYCSGLLHSPSADLCSLDNGHVTETCRLCSATVQDRSGEQQQLGTVVSDTNNDLVDSQQWRKSETCDRLRTIAQCDL